MADWVQTDAPDQVHVRLGAAQRRNGTVLAILVGVLVVVTAVIAGRPLLAVAGVAIGAVSAFLTLSLGVDLGPETITVRGPSIGRRTLWSRTLRWSSILDVRTTATGELWLSLPGEAPLVVRAPRRQWVTVDADFDDKVETIACWWRVRRDATASRSTADLAASVLAEVEASRAARARLVVPVDRPRGLSGPPPEAASPERSEGGDPLSAHALNQDRTRALDDQPFEPPSSARFSFVTLVAFIAIAVAVGYLLVGVDILTLGVALLVLMRFGRDPGRPVALVSFLLLAVAGVATIVFEQPAVVNMAFPIRRSVAVEAGAISGVFLVIATILFAVTERVPEPAPRRRLFRAVGRVDLLALRRFLPLWLSAAGPYVVIFLVAMVIRVVAQPAALPGQYDPLLANLRLGNGYSLAFPSGGVPAGQYPPLGPILVAYFPLGGGTILLVVSLLTVVAVAFAAHQRFGAAAGIAAAAVAAVLPTFWGQQLPVQLAGLFVVGGVAFADPTRATPRRCLAAGGCLGLAALARPDAALALLVVAWWVGQARRERPSEIMALLGAAVAVMLPWLNVVWSDFGPPWLLSTLDASLNDPSTIARASGPVGLALSAVIVVVLMVALRNYRERVRLLMPFYVIPAVTAALALTALPQRDLLTWSAPVAVVIIGAWLSVAIRRLFGPVLEHRPLVDWDQALDEAQRAVGADPSRRAVGRDDRLPVIDPQPDDEHLFL